MSVVENYRRVLESIAETAQKCGRNPNELSLLVVTKGHLWKEVLPLYEAGQRLFAESRLQEAVPKIAAAPTDVQWHMIGTLQKNKVRKAAGVFTLIHSVDTIELLEKISNCSSLEREKPSVLLQVNISGEAVKHGLSIDGWSSQLERLLEIPNVSIQGLMTMAPFVLDAKQIRRVFAGLRKFRDNLETLSSGRLALPHLSMGMSNDYQIAIQEGATIVRVGSAIFNP